MNFKEDIILENSRVKLLPLEAKHVTTLLPIALEHPTLLKYSPSPFGTKDKLEAYFKLALDAKTKNVRYPFIIFDKAQNRFVGSTSFGNVSPGNLRLEIGWTWLTKDIQGTGLNLYCKHLLLDYAFRILKYERVELKTDSRNLQSRKAIEKIGAIYEGELRSHTLMQDGYRRNTVYYGIIKEDWKGIEERIFGNIV